MVMTRLLRASAACLLLLSASCGDSEPTPRTQIMLVVDSDLEVPGELDSIVMHVEGPGGVAQDAMAKLGGDEPALPRSLALVHEKGPLSPLHVRVEGRRAGTAVVEREARLAFVAGRTLVLPMHLVRSCVGMACGEQTCTEAGCSDVEIDANELSAWSGDEPTLTGSSNMGDAAPPADDASSGQDGSSSSDDSGADGSGADGSDASTEPVGDAAVSTPDAGGGDPDACVAVPEMCNQADDDCDGVADNGIDLQSNANHCGECNNRCVGVARMCCAGVCMKSCM